MDKILQVNVDDLGYGGVFALVKNVIKNSLHKGLFDVAAIEKYQNNQNIKELESYGTKVHYVGYEKNKIIKQFVVIYRLSRLIAHNEYKIVHIHADVANKLLVMGAAARLGGAKKIILHSHAAGVDGNNRAFKLTVHYVCRNLLRFVGTDFVACSDLAFGWMYPWKKNSKIINNGVDLERFKYSEDVRISVRKEMKLEDFFVIGHVGRFSYQKNHEYIIEIFSELRKKYSNAKLLLVGEGELEKNIKQIADREGLLDDIIFYGTTPLVERLFQAMDVFILPSMFEGLPVVGVEAQAAGLPVIFSDNITKMAKITDDVKFLAINQENIKDWVECIESYMNFTRINNCEMLREKGFDSKETVFRFCELYSDK